MGEQRQQIQWYPGHMAKTRRMISENLKLVDAVLVLCDARIPYSSQNPDLQDILGNKPKLFLLNKSDLADKDATKQWIAFYKSEGNFALAVDCKSGKGISDVLPLARKAAEAALKKREEKGMNATVLRLMVVGIPNVGKSTLINRLAGRKTAKAEDRPGVTKGKQWVHLPDGSELLDMPGVLWPKFEDPKVGYHLAFTGAIKDQILDTEELAMELLSVMSKTAKAALSARYRLNEEDYEGDAYDLLETVGRKRGMLQSGGHVDTERAALMLLDEYRGNKLGRITLELPGEENNCEAV